MTRKRVHYLDRNLAHVMKFMCSEYELIMIYGYDDMIERVILQNGVYIMSWLSDHNERDSLAIPGHREYDVKSIRLCYLWIRRKPSAKKVQKEINKDFNRNNR